MTVTCKLCGLRRDAVVEPRACSGRALPGGHEWDEDFTASIAKESTILTRASEVAERRASEVASKSLGFGAVMAMILSWQLNHSILWMILHGCCSWVYVIYRAFQGNY